MSSPITREAVEALALQEGLTPLELLTTIQGAVSRLGDEDLLTELCALKSEFIDR
jgi:hypothetical protein